MGFLDPSKLPEIEPKPCWHGRFFHSDHMTFAYYEISAGEALHLHSHPNEEVWHIIEGEAGRDTGQGNPVRSRGLRGSRPREHRPRSRCTTTMTATRRRDTSTVRWRSIPRMRRTFAFRAWFGSPWGGSGYGPELERQLAHGRFSCSRGPVVSS